MIVVTGAAGFIGSCLLTKLNEMGFNNLVIVDDFSRADKIPNWNNKVFQEALNRESIFDFVQNYHRELEFFLHIGARTNTAEFDIELLNELNLRYSQRVWTLCSKFQIPLIYASSAATYGLGEQGYNDNEAELELLKPLNPYGVSKNEFDKWALAQKEKPFFWAGLKFFNVFGPNEYHKGRMASVIFHAYHQIKTQSSMKLFRSHNPNFEDGGQKRDFVYVKDLLSVIEFLMETRKQSGIYNLGTGQARTFLDLAHSVFAALGQKPQISFVDTPLDIRDKYQYYTQANMSKLRSMGYEKEFTPLEQAVEDYVQNYLVEQRYF
jgi:ADP-L-glycero-D-manno-heptose 6-epimerase